MHTCEPLHVTGVGNPASLQRKKCFQPYITRGSFWYWNVRKLEGNRAVPDGEKALTQAAGRQPGSCWMPVSRLVGRGTCYLFSHHVTVKSDSMSLYSIYALACGLDYFYKSLNSYCVILSLLNSNTNFFLGCPDENFLIRKLPDWVTVPEERELVPRRLCGHRSHPSLQLALWLTENRTD